MKRRMESIDHQPKLITIRPKIQQTNYDGYIVSRAEWQLLSPVFLQESEFCSYFQASAMRAVSMGDGGNFNNPFDQVQKQPEELRQPYVNGAVNGIAGSNHTGNIDHTFSLRNFLALSLVWQKGNSLMWFNFPHTTVKDLFVCKIFAICMNTTLPIYVQGIHLSVRLVWSLSGFLPLKHNRSWV